MSAHEVRRRELLAVLGWLAVLASMTAILRPFREEIEPGTAALVLLTAPLVATLGSLRVSVAAALVSALTFNYVFTEPYESLRIASDTGVAAFVVYLVIATALGVVVHRLRAQTGLSERRAAEATLLRDLTIDLVRQRVWLQPPLASALDELVRTLDLRGAALVVAIDGGESFVARAGASQHAYESARALAPGGDAEVAASGVRSLRTDHVTTWPITSDATVYGMLAIDVGDGGSRSEDEGSERTARLFANVVALACERATLVQHTIHQHALEETDRTRTALMQAVTHDLRTPLTSIRALASTLPSLAPPTAEQAEVIAEIETQAERLAKFVDQVLDLGRIDSGQLVPRLATLTVDDLVLAAVEATRDGTDDVVVAIDAGLPAVPVDEPLVQQVVVNLIENARRHGAPPIEVRARARDGAIELSVADHGRGVPEAERRRLFDPGYAMRRATADERSHGLGLAISAAFVEAHGGSIRVEPTPGGGATFVVTLPTDRRGGA